MAKMSITTQNIMGLIDKTHILIVNLRGNGKGMIYQQKNGLIDQGVHKKTRSIT